MGFYESRLGGLGKHRIVILEEIRDMIAKRRHMAGMAHEVTLGDDFYEYLTRREQGMMILIGALVMRMDPVGWDVEMGPEELSARVLDHIIFEGTPGGYVRIRIKP